MNGVLDPLRLTEAVRGQITQSVTAGFGWGDERMEKVLAFGVFP